MKVYNAKGDIDIRTVGPTDLMVEEATAAARVKQMGGGDGFLLALNREPVYMETIPCWCAETGGSCAYCRKEFMRTASGEEISTSH